MKLTQGGLFQHYRPEAELRVSGRGTSQPSGLPVTTFGGTYGKRKRLRPRDRAFVATSPVARPQRLRRAPANAGKYVAVQRT